MSMWEPRSSHLYVGGGGACPSVPPVLSVRPSAGPGHGRSPREWEFIVCVCAVSVCPFSPLCADPRVRIPVPQCQCPPVALCPWLAARGCAVGCEQCPCPSVLLGVFPVPRGCREGHVLSSPGCCCTTLQRFSGAAQKPRAAPSPQNYCSSRLRAGFLPGMCWERGEERSLGAARGLGPYLRCPQAATQGEGGLCLSGIGQTRMLAAPRSWTCCLKGSGQQRGCWGRSPISLMLSEGTQAHSQHQRDTDGPPNYL